MLIDDIVIVLNSNAYGASYDNDICNTDEWFNWYSECQQQWECWKYISTRIIDGRTWKLQFKLSWKEQNNDATATMTMNLKTRLCQRNWYLDVLLKQIILIHYHIQQQQVLYNCEGSNLDLKQ